MDNKIAAFTEAMLANNANAALLLTDADKAPDNPLLQCYAASLHLYAQTDESTLKASLLLKRAKKHAKKLSEVDTLMFQAINAWCLQNYTYALALFKRTLKADPKHLLALKYAEWLFYVIGQAFHAQAFLHLCESIKSHHEQNAYFLSVYAFALELVGKQTEAIHVANHALTLNPSLAWAQHALAHAHLMQGNIQIGIDALESAQGDWEQLVTTLQSHMYWHLSLLHIAKHQESCAMNIFQQKIWTKSETKKTVLVQQDTISFLCRMDLAGMPQNNYWPEIVSKIPLTHPHMLFNSLHYLYACGKNHSEIFANQLLEQAHQHALQQAEQTQTMWLTIGIPALKGIYAFSCDKHQQTIDLFTPILPQIGCVGGSDAEIELFHMIYCTALLKCNKKNKAKAHFEKHLMHYNKTPLQKHWFSN